MASTPTFPQSVSGRDRLRHGTPKERGRWLLWDGLPISGVAMDNAAEYGVGYYQQDPFWSSCGWETCAETLAPGDYTVTFSGIDSLYPTLNATVPPYEGFAGVTLTGDIAIVDPAPEPNLGAFGALLLVAMAAAGFAFERRRIVG